MILQRDLWELYCPERSRDELATCQWLLPLLDKLPSEDPGPVEFSDWLARHYATQAEESHRKSQGQFFTPPQVALFMARLSSLSSSRARVIDPGAGTGTLIAALAEHISQEGQCHELHAVAYETDASLLAPLALTLGFTRNWLSHHRIAFDFEIELEDFILSNRSLLRPTPLFDSPDDLRRPHLVVANPPYFKLPKNDPRVALLPEVVYGQPNVYALFMASAAKLLSPGGQLIFITPRSFCSGPYFRLFRKWFFHTLALERIHLFESRTDTFGRDRVLQENVIISARKAEPRNIIEVSHSFGAEDLISVAAEQVPSHQVLDLNSSEAVLNIPAHPADSLLREVFANWSDRLHSLGLDISTGPIVPFRTTALTDEGDSSTTAPVLWLQHVQRMAVKWPLFRFDKPQRIRIEPESFRLLLPNANYVLVRRFSAKEENSRITAAPYLGKHTLSSEYVGLENHLNYLHRPGDNLLESEVMGLAALLNSRWVDQYFRMFSGNTQISATELRNLPLPRLEKIRLIGDRLLESDGVSKIALINQVVGEVLDLPVELANNGGHMPKIEEAKDLLNGLGLPPAQRNEIAALTLLALAGLTESDPWKSARRRSIRIHDMISFIEHNYHKRYAENTRETFRRQVLHQFEQARLVDLNPDYPTLPTNSPRTHYAISEELLPVIQSYGTKTHRRHLDRFISERGTLLEIYQQRKSQHLIPLRDTRGHEYQLSPGKHNQLQVAVVEKFAPRFAPGAKLLYLGDTAHKTLIMNTTELEKVGFPADKHSKLPDIVLYVPKKRWLFLIEVVTAHGPVSPKRHRELEKLLAGSLGRIYVSVFPDFKEYLRHVREIAWETEVWIQEAPDHLIHYNGSKFLGPHLTPKP